MRSLRQLRAQRREDHGSATLEMVGIVPVAVAVLLTLIQVVFAVYTTHATNQAVRDGARAASLGRSAEVAIQRSLPDGLSAQSVSYSHGGEGVRLTVRVPRVAVFPSMTIDRTAVMPRTAP